MKNYIGSRIKECRKQKGWSQKRLANECGLSEAAIRKYESAERNAKYENIQKICDALQVDIRSMFVTERFTVGVDSSDNLTINDIAIEEFLKEVNEFFIANINHDMEDDIINIIFQNVMNRFLELNEMYSIVGSDKFRKLFDKGDI
ncbi:anaerobic benzoate catabolism transcriptional regulator [uncultured Clostridium sp.]|uniref:helix-turn-helix domain-containing protein n=1 Tax=uncultured Clostridium sp. TaxID=59620 RepID=UPI000822A3DF|nr:helix-turn-helix transcriptional regulator [uncultured Clostridium sp.]SCK01438.1 anaerobic benzoate catabolism transcriptional regulator [uncultured Clostridium sp.]